jgi:hypothetical protein
MSVTADRPAPYAPASAILSLIEKHRNRGLPSPIDAAVLERAGVSQSLIPRTLQALQTLDLVGEDGSPTDVLEGIRLAPEAEYQKRLADWLTDAYADALAFVDPATASETEIRDAFRKYVPTGQQDRMVSLFSGLFTAAGVMPERERKVAPRKRSGSTATRATKVATSAPRQQANTARQPSAGGIGVNTSGLPPALAGLLASLPTNGRGWTKEQRDKFVQTFEPVLDFCIPIVEQEPAPRTGEESGL